MAFNYILYLWVVHIFPWNKTFILKTSFQSFIMYALFNPGLINILFISIMLDQSFDLDFQLSLYETLSIDSIDNPPNEIF